MNLITGGEVLVDCLRAQGVRQVFSIIGGQMGTIYDTIGRREDMDLFVPRCETTVPLMAAGYVASTGRPAVSLTTVGAGVVYEVAGLACAWFDYLPVISLAPQVQSWKTKPHQESLQACNQDEIYFPLTKWNTIVYHWKRIPQLLTRAFREAYTGLPGPVHLDFPVDILFRRGIWGPKDLQKVPLVKREAVIPGAAAQIDNAAAALKNAGRGLVIVGQGIGRKGRYRGIRRLLNQWGWPVITTRLSAGILRGTDAAYAGPAALLAETGKGRELLKNADAIVVIGLDPETVALAEAFGWGEKPLVQIETDPSALLTAARFPVYADPISAVTGLMTSGLAAEPAGNRLASFRSIFAERVEQLAGDEKGINRAITALGKTTGEKDIIVADGPGIGRAAAGLLGEAEYRDLFCLDENEMPGAGLPFAIGAAIGNPDARVTLICDKESLFAHVREISPAALAGVALRLIVADNRNAAVNCADTAAVLEGLTCSVVNRSSTDAMEIPEFKARPITAVVVAPDPEKAAITADRRAVALAS
ncbi:MAG: thiamine pyrophosphate-binding protein [Thermodesulfobacteriota bacterium]